MALYAYCRYAEGLATRWYTITLIAFACGLMSKPMIMSFPVLLVLLDVWPLRRPMSLTRHLKEKLPCFGLSAIAGVIGYFTHAATGDLTADYGGPALDSLFTRGADALVWYVAYLYRTIWPVNLFAFRPYIEYSPVQQALAAVFLLSVCFTAWLFRRRAPWVFIGWLWFVVSLSPALRLVPFGVIEGSADRYLYVPMVGLLMIVAWTANAVWQKQPAWQMPLVVAGLFLCMVSAVTSYLHIPAWTNSVTFYQNSAAGMGRDLKANEQNPAARKSFYEALLRYGTTLLNAKDAIGAAAQFAAAIQVLPGRPEAHIDLGSALVTEGYSERNLDRAIMEYREGAKLAPASASAHVLLSLALEHDPKQKDNAKREMDEAIRLDPQFKQTTEALAYSQAY